MYSSAGQVVPTGTVTVVAFNTVDYDPNGNLVTGAAAKYNVPVNGIYLVTGNYEYGNSAATSPLHFIGIYKNTVQTRNGTGFTIANPATDPIAVVSTQLSLLAGDFIDLRVFHSLGGNNTGVAGSAGTSLQVMFLAPT